MTTPASAPPQLSPDGHWWWDGAQWIPAAQAHAQAAAGTSAEAVPAQASATPFEPGAAAVAATVPSFTYASTSSGWARWKRPILLGAVLAGLAAVAGTVVLMTGDDAAAPAKAAPAAAKPAPPAADPVLTVLKGAAYAEEAYWVDNGRYTAQIADLQEAGLEPVSGARVRVLAATKDRYCLQGSRANGTGRVYFSNKGQGPTTKPCA